MIIDDHNRYAEWENNFYILGKDAPNSPGGPGMLLSL